MNLVNLLFKLLDINMLHRIVETDKGIGTIVHIYNDDNTFEIELENKEVITRNKSQIKNLKMKKSEINLNKNYLVIFDGNYADEFDVSGFDIKSGSTLSKIFDNLENYDDRISIYFGTNEDLEFESGQELLDSLTITELSDSDKEVLKRLFGGAFGITNVLSRIEEDFDDDDDYDAYNEELNDDDDEWDDGSDEK